MESLTDAEKELIMVCLDNSLHDPEQEALHDNAQALYDKLKAAGWMSYR